MINRIISRFGRVSRRAVSTMAPSAGIPLAANAGASEVPKAGAPLPPAGTRTNLFDLFTALQNYGHGLTLVGGFIIIIVGATTYVVRGNTEIRKDVELAERNTAFAKELMASNQMNNEKLMASNKEHVDKLIEKDIAIVKRDAELTALKNILVFGQSEEYRGMRTSFARGEDAKTENDKK